MRVRVPPWSLIYSFYPPCSNSFWSYNLIGGIYDYCQKNSRTVRRWCRNSGEALFQIIENCTPEEIITLSDEWKNQVLGKIENAPRTDEDWSKLIFLTFGMWMPGTTPPTQEEQRFDYRKRIEFLREELKDALQIYRNTEVREQGG